MLKTIIAALSHTNAAPTAPAIRVLSASEIAAVAGGPEVGHDVKPNALIAPASPAV